MTTPKGSSGAPGQVRKTAQAAGGRVRRAAPAASGPKRAAAAATQASAASAASPSSPDAKVSDAVSHAVKLGYDVITENVRQGREAAARFSKGKYALRDAPGDIEVASLRLLHLARELSTTTFDVCERLLKELAAQKPPVDAAKGVPPFRAPKVTPAPKAASAPSTEPAGMKVTVRFAGAAKGIAHTASLSRPRIPAAPADITAQPLATSEGAAKPIAGVKFGVDVSIEGIVAQVSVPEGQPPGVYSGLVHVKGDPIPLGVLTIELAR